MAEKTKDIQDIGIMLADDWKLVPLDARNWELCHRHVGQARGRNDAGTEPRWFRCGRFYSYNTIGQALCYVADETMKAKARDQTIALADALAEYGRIADALAATITERA